MPIVAANMAVAPPIKATVHIVIGAKANRALQRTTIYTPAVTIVAA